ncbi:MAG: class I SAM-dependent methyltransferase [Candidatus Glassbacteria bacterium]
MDLGSRQYPEKLVVRVNELYHDLFSGRYHQSHPEITVREKLRWEAVGRRYFNLQRRLTVLDVGSGTGFVPLAVAPNLKEGDRFICSDVSAGMLDQSRNNLLAGNFRCTFDFVKIDPAAPLRILPEAGTIDIATLNSVLHHIKDTAGFLGELDRLLKPGGLVVIGHEPNRYFLVNPLLKGFSRLTAPRMLIDSLALKYSSFNRLKKLARSLFRSRVEAANEHERMTAEINRILLAEKALEMELLPEEIKLITDIRAREGFAPDNLLTGYEMVELDTYCYLGGEVERDSLPARSYEKMMRRLFPRSGAIFLAVLKKAPAA